MTTETQTIQYNKPDEDTRKHIAQQRSSLTRSGIHSTTVPALRHYFSPQKNTT